MTLNEELAIILKEELEILQNLREISYRKTDIIVTNQVEELEDITRTEESLINKIALKEKEREELLYNWGIKKNMSLLEIIEKIPEEKAELNNLKEELSAILIDIQTRNLLNNELIEENLQWLDFNMNLIYNTQTPTTYGNEEKSTGSNSLFDRKV